MDTAAHGRFAGSLVRRLLGLALVVVAALTLFAVGCGDDGGGGDKESAAVEAFLRQLYTDYNNKDVDAVLAGVTDKFLQDEVQVTRDEAPDVLA